MSNPNVASQDFADPDVYQRRVLQYLDLVDESRRRCGQLVEQLVKEHRRLLAEAEAVYRGIYSWHLQRGVRPPHELLTLPDLPAPPG